jgi:hypothetical protein
MAPLPSTEKLVNFSKFISGKLLNKDSASHLHDDSFALNFDMMMFWRCGKHDGRCERVGGRILK